MKTPIVSFLFILLGVLGNLLYVEITFGFEYLFGSIALVVLLLTVDLRMAFLGSVIIHSTTFYLYDHPFLFIIFMCEAFFLFYMIRVKQKKQLILYDFLFWLCIGAPMLFILYSLFLDRTIYEMALLSFRFAINNMTNITIGWFIYSSYHFRKWFGIDSKFTLHAVVTNILIGTLLISALILFKLNTKDINEQRRNVFAEMNHVADIVLDYVDSSSPLDDSAVLRYANDENILLYVAQKGEILYDTTIPGTPDWHHIGVDEQIFEGFSIWYPSNQMGETLNSREAYYVREIIEDDKVIIMQSPIRVFLKELIDSYTKTALVVVAWIILFFIIYMTIHVKLFKPIKNLTEIHKKRDHSSHYLLAIQEFQLIFSQFNLMIDEMNNTEQKHQTDLSAQTNSLQKELKRMKDIFFALEQSVLICIVNKDYEFVFVNDIFCDTTQVSRKEIIGRKFTELNDREVWLPMYNNLNKDASIKNWRGKVKALRKDGEPYWLDTMIVPFRDDQALPYQYISISIDITIAQTLEEQKNNFISMVSHELRTPMTAIYGLLERLQFKNLAEDKQKKYIGIIYEESKRLSYLIDNFLDFQRLSVGKVEYSFKEENIKHLLESIIERWQSNQHDIHVRIPENEVLVEIDSDRMIQILHNLISNAIKYSPKADRIDITLEDQEDTIAIHIKDYGVGIPTEAIDRIFEKFYRVDNSDTREIGGTGMGLAISQEIVKGHHGELYVQSEFGQGSTFTIKLPKKQPLNDAS